MISRQEVCDRSPRTGDSMVMTSDRARWAKKRAHWARENSACLHRLLSERHPEFLATLESAERQVDLEMSRAAAGFRDHEQP
jgi:hypothetical protein